MTKDIYYKLGSRFKKYWWALIILALIVYFWPQDHFKNCLNDYRNVLKGKYNDKEDRQGAILVCEQIKKSNPDLFREYKGKIFTKTTLFVPR
jgi:hypothetical protein